MNGVPTQLGGTWNKSNNKRGHKEANKSSSIIYHYFICNVVETKTYDCLHKDAIHALFKKKGVLVAPKKDDVVVNMILVVTIHNQIPKKMVFKEKKPLKNKSFNVHLKKPLKTYNKKNHLELVYKLRVKPTSSKNLV